MFAFHMSATLESTTDGILVTDITGKVTGYNESTCRCSGSRDVSQEQITERSSRT